MNIEGEKLNNEESSQEQSVEQKNEAVTPDANQAEGPKESIDEDKNLEESNSEPVASEPEQPVVPDFSPANEPNLAPAQEAVPADEASPAEELRSDPAPETTETVPDQEDKTAEESVAPVSSEEVVEATQPERPKGEFRWYVIQTFTGKEDVVKQGIEQTIGLYAALKAKVAQVLVPTEEIVEIKAGKRVEKIKKMFPGYVFLEMILDEESWYLIRQTVGVSRFIGTKVRPTPVSEKEMQRVLKQLGKEERLEITFERGEGVRVISGPFRGYTGTVDEVNPEKGKLKVLINIFGRDTPVEVNFEHAQKIS